MAVDGPVLALQGAIIAALRASEVVEDMVGGRVYDQPPTNATYPYISINSTTEQVELAECLDGTEVSILLDAWSRATGRPEVLKIANAVRSVLHLQEFDVNGFHLVEMRYVSCNVMMDVDGLTHHAVITLSADIEPAD
jgi:hypothetical protein